MTLIAWSLGAVVMGSILRNLSCSNPRDYGLYRGGLISRKRMELCRDVAMARDDEVINRLALVKETGVLEIQITAKCFPDTCRVHGLIVVVWKDGISKNSTKPFEVRSV